jgi:ankyrin repeat protein
MSHLFYPIVATLIPRGFGVFLGIAIPVAMIVVAISLKWIGAKTWLRSITGAVVGFVFYPLVLGILLWALSSEKYGEALGWSMLFGLPILIGIALLFVAWLANVAILCAFGGKRAGMITGFVIMPVMWMLCFGGGANLLGLFEKTRGSLDTLDAVKRGDYPYLEKLPVTEQSTHVWRLALEHLDPRAAELALQAGADVNGQITLVGDVPQTPLQVALDPLATEAWSLGPDVLRARQIELVDLLINHGADVNLAGPRDEDPLGLAILKTRDPAIVKTLMNAGAVHSTTNPPLHLASYLTPPEGTELVSMMLDAGADPNFARPADRRTPLQCAAISGNIATLRLLIERGARVRPGALASPDEAPVLLAALNRRPDNAIFLIESGADPHARTTDGLSAWQISRDPSLRLALEAKGVPREIETADFSAHGANFTTHLMNAFGRNTSLSPVVGEFSAVINGAGPWNMIIPFPEDLTPVLLTGVSCIELQALGADSAGNNINVQNTVYLGDEKPPQGMRQRRIERLDPFSPQVRLGYAITFYFERESPVRVSTERKVIPKPQ